MVGFAVETEFGAVVGVVLKLGVATGFEAEVETGFGVVAVAGFWFVAGFYVVGLGTGFADVTEFAVGFGIVVVAGPVVRKSESAD